MELQALKRRSFLGAKLRADLGEVVVIEHTVSQVELVDNLAIFDAC